MVVQNRELPAAALECRGCVAVHGGLSGWQAPKQHDDGKNEEGQPGQCCFFAPLPHEYFRIGWRIVDQRLANAVGLLLWERLRCDTRRHCKKFSISPGSLRF